ncbi:hypothetical protein RhiirA1_503301 [Rhizophagus irregularis]|uniref:Actin-like ATPase domain-containing protein n=2 Tax=Rhizophagus irregularis TaxID=588596 RepID=A0A2N0S2R5_9GLOM|nr:hypothetical protein RhiirA1_503301 [Rhizophagus irregularis]
MGRYKRENNENLNSEENNENLNSEENNENLNSEENNENLTSEDESWTSEENNENLNSEENNENLTSEDNNGRLNSEEINIRVVIGLDFGTTYSGFAYCHVKDSEICSNNKWHGKVGQLKTNTVLQYDDDYNNVKLWGELALAKKQSRSTKKQKSNEGDKPVELFKLHLADLLDKFKPELPVDYKKAFTDYLREIGKVIKETVETHWPLIDYFKNILLVITVPAEFSEKSKAIMRRCAFNAELIKEECSTNLQFTTEPNFMVIDCGGGTVDITIRKLLNDKQLGEITERAGDFCGSTFIDAEFIKYLQKRLGDEPMNSLRDNNYGQMQYLIQQFCKFGKIPFTGDDPDFIYELDIRESAPTLMKYITDVNIRKPLEKDEWVIEIDFETIKSIFEPVVQKIVRLIKVQLDNAQEMCSAMFLVGVPTLPVAAISRGAVIYGLSIKSSDLNNIGDNDNMKCVISSRVLKYTYGISYFTKWKEGDPMHRKDYCDYIEKFHCLARRGTRLDINQKIETFCAPLYRFQSTLINEIYYTREYDGEYCDDPGMKLLGKFHTDLPGYGIDRNVLLEITFGKMELIATAKNMQTGQSYRTTFKFNFDD